MGDLTLCLYRTLLILTTQIQSHINTKSVTKYQQLAPCIRADVGPKPPNPNSNSLHLQVLGPSGGVFDLATRARKDGCEENDWA